MVRLVSGVVLSAAALAAIRFLPLLGLRVLATAVAALAAHEYLRLSGSDRRLAGVGAVSCWLTSLDSATYWGVMLLLVGGLDVGRGLLRSDGRQKATTACRAAIYTGIPLGLLVAVHARYGWRATLLLLATVVVSDSAQFYTGRLFGRHPLAPTISPKKTVEGAVGGVVCGTAFMAVAGPRALPFAGVVPLLALGIVVVVLGICGDLFESRMKRQAGVKDSGSLIPGHGGVLDRIDALLFATPAFYIYLRNVA